jgi:hypothetical protein
MSLLRILLAYARVSTFNAVMDVVVNFGHTRGGKSVIFLTISVSESV